MSIKLATDEEDFSSEEHVAPSRQPGPSYVGRNIRTFREKRKMSRRELALAAGLPSATHIGNIERGDIWMPRADTLVAIADALGISTKALLENKSAA